MSDERPSIQQWALSQEKTESAQRPEPFRMESLARILRDAAKAFERPGDKDARLRAKFYVSPYTRDDE